MSTQQEVGKFFAHYGVKGMHWGVRKDSPSSPGTPGAPKPGSGTGWSISKDGTIEIQKGVTLSRVVRNTKGLFGGTGADLNSGRPIYAAFKPGDVVSYEHGFGRAKGLLTKEASTVLKLTATTKLKAPGPKEATAIYYDMLKKNPAVLAELKSAISPLGHAKLEQSLKDPGSSGAYEQYSIALDAANYSKKPNSINAHYFDAVKKAGYNMLLDPSDAFGGFDAPVMVLDAGKNLKVTSQYIVDKVSAEKARKAFKSYSAQQGKTYLESLGYA